MDGADSGCGASSRVIWQDVIQSVPWWPILNMSDVTTDTRGLFLLSVTSAAQCWCLLWTDEAVDGLNRSQPPPGAEKTSDHHTYFFGGGCSRSGHSAKRKPPLTPADVWLFSVCNVNVFNQHLVARQLDSAIVAVIYRLQLPFKHTRVSSLIYSSVRLSFSLHWPTFLPKQTK